MDASGTCRRFSRTPDVISAVRSGASRCTASVRRPLTSMRWMTRPADAPGREPVRGAGKVTSIAVPAAAPPRGLSVTVLRSSENSPAFSTRARCA